MIYPALHASRLVERQLPAITGGAGGPVDRRASTRSLLLQETKCSREQFTDLAEDLFRARGYQVAHHGRDHWNGVAIASRVGLDDRQPGFNGHQRPPFDEARILSATVGGAGSHPIRVVSVYVPNGRTLRDPQYLYKLVWLERLRAESLAQGWAGQATIIAGDFNVAPSDQDIYDPRRWRGKTHASPQERAAVGALEDLGFVDAARTLHPDTPQFTWWNYRQVLDNNRGLRIDLALVSKPLWPRVVSCRVDRAARAADRPSDHAPLVIDLDHVPLSS